MKKFMTTLLVVTLSISSLFANNSKNRNNVDERVEKSFKKTFASAQQESWSRVNNLNKVQFNLNGQVLFAYLDDEGTLVGVYRNILSTQLPISLMTEIKEEYSDYWISTLFEVANEGTTTYYITLENAGQQLVLKSENSSSWSVFSRTKK
ncbi:hypothetical protein [Flavihumibacter sp. UBA7668]|uniref:hypothetical protein n=1 Tax=Flavihumibacter sp. UBA7668 TaxID=1946542 RepID=UPI0025C1A27C|nr:hypothetical protein [Flavihumibacter sp. UBA7668]